MTFKALLIYNIFQMLYTPELDNPGHYKPQVNVIQGYLEYQTAYNLPGVNHKLTFHSDIDIFICIFRRHCR